MESLFKSLPGILKFAGNSPEVRESVIFAAWRRIAGPSLAAQTAPVGLAERSLTVAVKDEGWRRHLADLSGQMIFKLNSTLGSAEITFIEFIVEPGSIRSRTNEPAGSGTDDRTAKDLPAELVESAAKITDENLRKLFLAAAAGCLERKDRLGG